MEDLNRTEKLYRLTLKRTIVIIEKMSRKKCTDCLGGTFPKSTRDAVWEEREPHPWGENWGYDRFRNIIKYQDYGKVSKKYGWDIDHSKPVSKEGTDHLNNLQPLQSYYNRYIKSDHYPWGKNQHSPSWSLGKLMRRIAWPGSSVSWMSWHEEPIFQMRNFFPILDEFLS